MSPVCCCLVFLDELLEAVVEETDEVAFGAILVRHNVSISRHRVIEIVPTLLFQIAVHQNRELEGVFRGLTPCDRFVHSHPVKAFCAGFLLVACALRGGLVADQKVVVIDFSTFYFLMNLNVFFFSKK